MDNIAILYQKKPAPKRDGIQKPMKIGGYSDSGADIGFCLHKNGIELICPVDDPDPLNDYDWIFPDTEEGIERAINKGANVFWLNTVLFKNHPIELYFERNIKLIGQVPEEVDKYDDKVFTNELLKKNNLPIPKNSIIKKDQIGKQLGANIKFPKVVKPIRGRGSQGVTLVHNEAQLISTINNLFEKGIFGDKLYVEQFLPGQEITITVLPPGAYEIDKKKVDFKDYWTLPVVKRFNHQDGVAPYNGLVAVINNSQVLSEEEMKSDQIEWIRNQCKEAAGLLKVKAPIRIDCRADNSGQYFMFDLNMKPNMTGAARAHRKNQDSLTMIAARKIGWTYFDLLKNILNQKWVPLHK